MIYINEQYQRTTRLIHRLINITPHLLLWQISFVCESVFVCCSQVTFLLLFPPEGEGISKTVSCCCHESFREKHACMSPGFMLEVNGNAAVVETLWVKKWNGMIWKKEGQTLFRMVKYAVEFR